MNAFTDESSERIELHRVDPAGEERQRERTARRPSRAETPTTPRRALALVREAAAGEANLLPPMRDALRAHCTVGEICGVLRELWGTYDGR